MISLILENNNFVYDDKNFKQVDGTAISSRLGEKYVCTYMGELGEERKRREHFGDL